MKILKWIGIVLGGLVLLIALAAGGMIASTTSRFNKTYTYTLEPLTVSVAEGDLAVGAHWAKIHCRACHGEDLSGGPFFEDPGLGYVDAPNLTSGQGGIGAAMTDEDWVRAIRYGIKHDGTSVFIMPSNDFYFLSDADLAGIIAYVKSVPPVDREIRARNFKPFAKILYAVGAFGNLLYAETIPHTLPPSAPAMGVTVEYGEYLVNAHGCKSCHGEALSGKQPSEPGAPLAPNLTPGGELATWTEADFMNLLRTGTKPSGEKLSDYMPWQGLGKMTDDELKAVWMSLQALPATATTTK